MDAPSEGRLSITGRRIVVTRALEQVGSFAIS